MASTAKPVVTIGSTELIAFPDFQLVNIPAKVDTGADSSAVWASNITLDGETLSYALFGAGSVFYTGEPIRTSTYRVTRVRNSFGHQEFRYKVKLRVKVGNKRLLSWFTLADRSNNTYPVLLGKNFLKTRFVVDVARNHALRADGVGLSKVMVFSRDPVKNQAFFDQVQKRQSTPAMYINIGYESLLYHLEPRNVRVVITPSGQDVADSDLVYLKTHRDNAEQAKAVVDYLRYRAVRYVGREIDADSSASKLSEYMRLVTHDLPVPTSIAGTPSVLVDQYDELVTELGVPFVLKESSSDRGKNNFLIESPDTFAEVLTQASREHVYIAQRYIPNDGYVRLLVAGRNVVLAIQRTPVTGHDPLKAHLNQPRGSENAVLRPLDEIPAHVQDISVRAAAVMKREIAGIDVIKDRETNQWYILEANNAPQIRSGAFVDEKVKAVAEYFDHELNQ